MTTNMPKCEHCKDWGETVLEGLIIHCPKCNRPTWVNLGVNCPAGMDWAVAGFGANLYETYKRTIWPGLLARARD